MHKIYTNSWFTEKLAMPISRGIGRATAFIAKRPRLQKAIEQITGEKIIAVERSFDYYQDFAVVKVELGQKELSPSQRIANAIDPRYKGMKDFYLVSMVSMHPDPKTKRRMQREFIFDRPAYNQLGLDKPTLLKPIGNGENVIGKQIYTIGTAGQNSLSVVPRAHIIKPSKASPRSIHSLEKELRSKKKPSRRIRFSFMGPKPN